MRVLITGITGFVGSHLAEFLLREEPQVELFGLSRPRSPLGNIQHIQDHIHCYEGDIRDAHSIHQMIRNLQPDYIFHLAAQSYVPASWHSPVETWETNAIGQCNLLEAIRPLRTSGYDPAVVIAGSSEEYGLIDPGDVPINEETPLRPASPYAVSKIAQDYMGYQYFRSYGIRIVRCRAFNHEGPRRGEPFVTSNFARQVAEIEAGIKPPVLYHGNLDAVRDFTDVRDVVRAYWLAANLGQPGEVYNIASGVGYSMRQLVSRLQELSAVKDIELRQDPQRMRPSDVPLLIGDASKFRALTGWSPAFDFMDQTLPDILNYWRGRVSSMRLEQ